MLTLLLRSEIDNKWEACWPVSQVKPFAFFELLSFLFFIRKIEGLHPAADPVTGTVFTTKEFEKLRWSTFNGMDAQNMHNLFTRKNGLIDLMTNYSYSGERYQSFFKEPLLLTPTPKLLFNSVNLIKVLEGQGQDTRREIFTYLLNKVEITAQSGQVYTPQPVAQLVVSMLAPQMDDTILDILAGDGSFLAGCITHIATAGGDSHGFNRDLFPNLNGTDIDPAALRIAAMNLMLHGVEEPVLQKLKPLDNAIINAKGGATVAFANLIFKESDGKLGAAHNAFKEDFYNKEVQLLEILLNNLAVGGRAAVIIPPVLLHNNKEEVLKIRQRIVDEHTLEAVIRLPQKQGAFFRVPPYLFFQGNRSPQRIPHGSIKFQAQITVLNCLIRTALMSLCSAPTRQTKSSVYGKPKNRIT